MSFCLVIGGVKSGKTRFAQKLAEQLSTRPIYLATSRVWDDDHRERILRHQADRGERFETIECETELDGVATEGRVVVVDCVTLWLANYSYDEDADVERCRRRAIGQLDQLVERRSTFIFVTNELGQGVHPETRLGRKFVDLQGIINQELARRSARVWLMCAGIALPIKGSEGSLDDLRPCPAPRSS